MGLLSKLGGAVKEGLRKGAVNGLLKATGNSSATGQVQFSEYSYDANGNIKGVNSKFVADIADRFGSSNSDSSWHIGGIGSAFTGKVRSPRAANGEGIDYPTKYKTTAAGLEPKESTDSRKNYSKTEYNIVKDTNSDIYNLKLPDWSYADFINERAIWQKGLSSVFDEPAWFYFKIFFDFDTNHGLFGGLLNDTFLNSATNSAAKYLYTVRNLHKNIKARDRVTALYKMASILSYINPMERYCENPALDLKIAKNDCKCKLYKKK